MAEHGLLPEDIDCIDEILRPYRGCIEKVALFGSRATGKFRPESDIDLVLYGDVAGELVSRLESLFAESALPYPVDVVAYRDIRNPTLKAHIDRFKRYISFISFVRYK